MKITNVNILTPRRIFKKATLSIDKGKIVEILPPQSFSGSDVIDAEGWIASPGWIDLQINGGFGYDLTTDPERLWDVAEQLPKFGVTGFLPTIISSTPETYPKAIRIFRCGPPKGWKGARPFGWHFEGPFLNLGKKGAHNPDSLLLPDKDLVADWSRENGVAMVTMAPELPGAEEVARQLLDAGVMLSMGHSMATMEETRHAVSYGFTTATHLFNAMPALDHRAPGLAGEALANDAITVGIIADGLHVHPDLVKIAWKMKAPDKIVLVSDAVGALGVPPGEFLQGGMEIIVGQDSARLKNGTLAGSVLKLDRALRNVMEYTGAPMEQVLPALGVNQSRLLNLENHGVIREGYCADLTLVDAAGNLRMTIVDGEILYQSE